MNQDGVTVLSGMFHSLGNVLTYDPWRIVLGYPVNLLANVRHSLVGNIVSLPVAGLALAGAMWALVRRRSHDLLRGPLSRYVLRPAPRLGSLGSALLPVRRRDLRRPGLACPCRRVDAGAASGPRTGPCRGSDRPRAVWLGAFTQARCLSLPGRSLVHEIIGACEYLQQQGVSGARILARKPHLPLGLQGRSGCPFHWSAHSRSCAPGWRPIPWTTSPSATAERQFRSSHHRIA